MYVMVHEALKVKIKGFGGSGREPLTSARDVAKRTSENTPTSSPERIRGYRPNVHARNCRHNIRAILQAEVEVGHAPTNTTGALQRDGRRP